MDKNDNINTFNHSISLNERKNIMVTGVKKIESFDDHEFLMETSMGYLYIKGENLEIIKLKRKKKKKAFSLNYLNEFKNTNIFSFIFIFVWYIFFIYIKTI